MAWDEFLGGHDFDSRIAKLMGEQFDEAHSKNMDGVSVFDSPRAMARLLKEAERYKVVLSSNKETPMTVEALTNDIDFRSHITREQFLEMCADLLERSTKPVEQLLEETGKEPSEVHAVVIIGGGSRIPQIQENLKKVMDREELNRNLNGDEAAALGAGFYAAGLSPSFRVRKVSVEDIFPYGVTATVSRGASSTSEKPPPTAEVFGKNSKMPLKKVLTFNRKEDFYMDIKVSNPERLPNCDSALIGAYNITNVEKAVAYNETEKPKISITFELDRSGLLVVTKAEGKAESWTEETVKKEKKAAKNETADENATATEDGEDKEEDGAEEKSEDATEEEKTEEAAEEEATEDSEEAPADGEEKSEDAADSDLVAEDEEETETKMVKKVHRVALDWNFTALDMTPMTEAQSSASKKMIKEIQKRMDDIAKMNKIKNDVESHVFQTRDAFEYNDLLKSVMAEDEMDTIRASLSEVEEWLWDDHELKEYEDKLKDLIKEMKPANTRKQELEDRPKALSHAKEQISSIKAYLANETAMENVHPNETAVIQAATESFEAWVTEKEAAQEAVALTDPPAVLAADIYTEADGHRDTVSAALRPKPKPKAAKVKKDGPVETKKEKSARLKWEKADKAAKKATKNLNKLISQLGEECGLPATCVPVPVEPEEPKEVAEGEEAAAEDDAEEKDEPAPVDCSFTEDDESSCGEGCTYTAASEATNPKPVETEEAAEEDEAAAEEDAPADDAEEPAADADAEEGDDAAEEKKPAKKEKKKVDTCTALPKSVKKAEKTVKTTAKAATKAEEEYTKEKAFVEANRAARLAKEAKKAEEAEAKKAKREARKAKAAADDDEGDDAEEEEAEDAAEEDSSESEEKSEGEEGGEEEESGEDAGEDAGDDSKDEL